MAYEIDKPTASTKKLLEYIFSENQKNNKPSLKDVTKMGGGTWVNWCFSLKRLEAGYLTNGDGLTITEKGKELLQQLRENPPQERRGKRKFGGKIKAQKMPMVQNAPPQQQNQQLQPLMYEVSVTGTDMIYKIILNREAAGEVINCATAQKIKQEKEKK